MLLQLFWLFFIDHFGRSSCYVFGNGSFRTEPFRPWVVSAWMISARVVSVVDRFGLIRLVNTVKVYGMIRWGKGIGGQLRVKGMIGDYGWSVPRVDT